MPSTRDAALALCSPLTASLEGCRLSSYPDTGGVPSIGYGHTGPEVRLGQSESQDIALHDLAVDLNTAADRLEEHASSNLLDVILENHERAALIDFVFNLGAGPAQGPKEWQIWEDLRNEKVSLIPGQIQRFDHGIVNGVEQEIPGLEHRRTAEIVFFNTADAAAAIRVTQTANVVQAPSSGYTRSIVTPPRPVPAPPGATASLVAKSLTVVGGLTAAVGSNAQQVHDIIAPASDAAPIFQTLATIAIGAVVICGVIGLFIHEAQAQARKT